MTNNSGQWWTQLISHAISIIFLLPLTGTAWVLGIENLTTPAMAGISVLMLVLAVVLTLWSCALVIVIAGACAYDARPRTSVPSESAETQERK